MAIVRELITTLGYKVDETGLKQYEAGFARIKEMTLGFASAMGLAFSVEKISEFIDGLLESGQEILKLRAQITNLARPMDDVNSIMETSFNIAQEIGVAYTSVLDTFRELLNVSQDTKISQDELLKSTENVYKALKIDRATAEESKALFSSLNRIFQLGAARPMTIGRIERLSPSTLKMLEEHFNVTNVNELRALAKAHKITTEEVVKALSVISPEMQDRFEKVPWRIGRAYIYARNQMVRIISSFLEATRVSILLGTAIKFMTDVVVNFLRALRDAFGGVKNIIEPLTYALMLALGPWLIRQLAAATAWTIRWAVATAAANWQWILLGASILAVAVAIQDVVYWIQGKQSLIGTWVGSFADVKQSLGGMNELAPFRMFNDLFKGDFKGALDELKISLTTIQGLVVTIGTLFVGWNALKFLGLISAITGVTAAAKEAAAATAAMSGASATSGAPAGGGKGPGFLGWLSKLGLWLTLATSLKGDTPGGAAGGVETSPEDLKRITDQANQQQGLGYTGSFWHDTGQFLKNTFQYLGPGMGEAGKMFEGAVPPGAMGRPSTDSRNQSVTTTLNQSNNITVTTDDQSTIAKSIQDKLSDIGKFTTDAITKQITASMPRTEAATQ